MVLGIAGLTLLMDRRGFCYTLCWMAPFMIVGQAVADLAHHPALRLRAQREECARCGACTRACPMNLDVQRMVEGANPDQRDRILYARCADIYPKSELRDPGRRSRLSVTDMHTQTLV